MKEKTDKPEDLRAMLASIVESSDEAIVSKALDGTILSWNHGAENTYGYMAHEAIGKNISMLVPKERMKDLLNIYGRLARGEHIDHFETVRITKDGRHISVSLTISPIKDGAGKVIAASAISRDITQRKAMEERLKKLSEEWDKTFNAITDFIFIADKDNNIIKSNKAFTDFLKKMPEEVIGKKCYDILHGLDKPWPACPFEKTKIDFKTHVEEVDDPHIGVPLLITTSPVFNDNGEFVGIVHVAKDISNIKKVENELIKKIKDLERFQKITVDRELKMKELKAKIAELEARVKSTQNG